MQKSTEQKSKTADPKAKTGPVDSHRLNAKRLGGLDNDKYLDAIKETKKEVEDSSDLFTDDDVDAAIALQEKKEALINARKNREAVRQYEIKIRDGVFENKWTDDFDDNGLKQTELLWRRLRTFFSLEDDLSQAREGFRKACERYADKQQMSVLPFEKVKQAFNAAFFSPQPTDHEYQMLFSALEVWKDEDLQTVQWQKILDATLHRETKLYHGIFPKILIKTDIQADRIEQRRKDDEIARDAEKLKELEQKKKLAEAKRLLDFKNSSLKKSIKVSVSGSAKQSFAKDDQKRKEAELKHLKDQEKAEQEKVEKAEKKFVARDALVFKKQLSQIQGRFREMASFETMMNWFKFFDKNARGSLESKEFVEALAKKGVRCTPDEIEHIYKAVDFNIEETRRINYIKMLEIMYGRKSLDVEKYVKEVRYRSGMDQGYTEEEVKRMKFQSLHNTTMHGGAEPSSFSLSETLGSVGKRSCEDNVEVPRLVDLEESSRNFQSIRKEFSQRCFSFEVLLSKLGIPKYNKEHLIMLTDFERAVVDCFGNQKFSGFQIRQVFLLHAIMQGLVENAFIPVHVFKHHFYPGNLWKPEYNKSQVDKKNKEKRQKMLQRHNEGSEMEDEDDNTSEISLAIDDQMKGKGFEDLKNEEYAKLQKEDALDRMERSKFSLDQSYQGGAQELDSISEASQPLDDFMRVNQKDPRVKFRATIDNSYHMTDLNASNSENDLEQNINTSFPQSEVLNFQKQKEREMMNKYFDTRVDNEYKQFASRLMYELQKNKGRDSRPEYYIEQYGKETDGCINYQEFKQIYMQHFFWPEFQDADQEIEMNARNSKQGMTDDFGQKKNKSFKENTAEPEENLIKALFNTIDVDQRQKILQYQFIAVIKQASPLPTFFQRLKMKIKRGGRRLCMAMREDCREVDQRCGYNHVLPIPVFQELMASYDLTMIECDKQDLKENNMLQVDKTHQEMVCYSKMFEQLMPAAQIDANHELKMVNFIQRMYRGFLGRRIAKAKRVSAEMGEMAKLTQKLMGTAVDPDDEPKKGAVKKVSKSKGKPPKEESKKSLMEKEAQQQLLREKLLEDQRRVKQQAQTATIVVPLIEALVLKAVEFGESLKACKQLQRQFEKRQVTKYVFPMFDEMQITTQGMIMKSLQTYNGLGQLMFLNAQNQLNQYDITRTQKPLQTVNLGTRPPLKHYEIIDLVVCQKSGRIYTLNSNWILEIWNVEQSQSSPQTRIAVCQNDDGRDYIDHFYKQTFNDSKPNFLCLQESNQQVLVVNTTCVDGSLVFIDPISFSILKRIQLRYQDFELPQRISDCCQVLQDVFQTIKREQGKDLNQIFLSIMDLETQEISIKGLVAEICKYDNTQIPEVLYKTCRVLDEDNSGTISLDEFLNFFGSYEQKKEGDAQFKLDQEMLQDEIWPQWVIDEQKKPQAETLLASMFAVLEKNLGTKPEEAFALYDKNNTGLCTEAEFKRILSVLFRDVMEDGDIDFLLLLTKKNHEAKILYRQFCQFLTKKLVKSFKHAKASIQSEVDPDGTDRSKSALQLELERPLIKEATLSYIVRKAAELKIDLRKEFINADTLQLNVIPRLKFCNILMSLPFGLSQSEMEEILESDLAFDNCGNVEYEKILETDLFLELERKMILSRQLEEPSSRKRVSLSDSSILSPKEKSTVDKKRVVIEDLLFIDDHEIIIYTTVRPRTSTVFITSLSQKQRKVTKTANNYVIELKNLSEEHDKLEKTLQNIRLKQQADADEQGTTSKCKLIAKLKGHKNQDAPTICYVPQSNCLVTGEKHQEQSQTQINSTKCEIIVWNLQREMIDLYSTGAPWVVSGTKKFTAHDASIIQITYMGKCQLIVSTSMDQSIRFWDPVSATIDLTDKNNKPMQNLEPDWHRTVMPEKTNSNTSFKEVKRIYTGADTTCYGIRTLNISDVVANAQQPTLKSQLEWLICVKNPKTGGNQDKKKRLNIISGYCVERIKIEVPALHVDDIVPPHIIDECEELVKQRRLKIVTAFQKQLPLKVERLQAQTSIQLNYMEQVRSLLLQAVLTRTGKYMNPQPLRDMYNLLLKLPTRAKFQSFLASNGCSNKLSTSETFFYLSMFMQIQPLRTTQIEFERTIEDFYKRNSRQYLRGVKRWPKPALQKFASYIKSNGLNIAFLQEPASLALNGQQNQKLLCFCTRDRFVEYFLMVNELNDHTSILFSQEEIDLIIYELDPYNTGVIQISQVQRYYSEEITFHQMISLHRPQEIINQIRAIAFPNRKIAVQQALTAEDEHADGYITLLQFINAMYKAGINVDRDRLEQLFEVMADDFSVEGESREGEQKYLHLPFFMSKLFKKEEMDDINDIDNTLSHIKAALIYKGIDFGCIFAEATEDDESKPQKKQETRRRMMKKTDQDAIVDLNCHYTRFAQQMERAEFKKRVLELQVNKVSPLMVDKLINYLCLNQKNQSIIFLNSWLHHLRRVKTQFQIPDFETTMPLICSKLLSNEAVFRSYLESIGQIKQNREEDKFIELPNLRQVLKKFGVNYVNQGLFLKSFTTLEKVHIEDLLTKMKKCVYDKYYIVQTANASTLLDLTKTDYFNQFKKQLKQSQSEIKTGELMEKFAQFDTSETGSIASYILINVLKHSYPNVFQDQTLLGLQYELECLCYDQSVDYAEFVHLFVSEAAKKSGSIGELKLDLKRDTYTLNDYEDLLGRISIHVKDNGLDLEKIFSIFSKTQSFIKYGDLRKILELINFKISEKEFDLLIMFADENSQQTIHAYDVAQQIVNAQLVAPVFNLIKWKIASRDLEFKVILLEKIFANFEKIREQVNLFYGEGKPCGVLTGEQMLEVIRSNVSKLSEKDLTFIITYAIKGSRRDQLTPSETVSFKNDLVQLNHFEIALPDVISFMNKENTNRKAKEASQNQKETQQEKMLREAREAVDLINAREISEKNTDAYKRQQELVNKVTGIFRERQITFHDAFATVYDPNALKNVVQKKQFKECVLKLNLPLTVQDHRVMNRISDPKQTGKIDLAKFILRFETADLRKMRLNKVLDKVATAFFVSNFSMKKAFEHFDIDGDGKISREEFRNVFASLHLNLKLNEIDEIFKMIATQKDNTISQEDFMNQMDFNIKHRRLNVADEVEERLFKKVSQALRHGDESLFEAMKHFDYDKKGSIQVGDLKKVFKRLGLISVEEHIPLLLKSGGNNPNDTQIQINNYCKQFQIDLEKRIKSKEMKTINAITRVYSLLMSNKISIFDLFVKLDTNISTRISFLELKTGLASLGMKVSDQELELIWEAMHKQKENVEVTTPKQKPKDHVEAATRDKKREEEICYIEMIEAFVKAGCIQIKKTNDRAHLLIAKYKQNLKKSNLSVEGAFKQYDPQNLGYVFRHEFIALSHNIGLEFSADELHKIYDEILIQGLKPGQNPPSRINYKQFTELILVNRDKDWLYLAYIKINTKVQQMGFTYKRLFLSWKGKKSAGNNEVVKASPAEIKNGLKKLKAGLTSEEVEKLVGQFKFDAQKEQQLSVQEFENAVVQGAMKLEQEKAYETMLLTGWITQFNNQMKRNSHPLDNLFLEFDENREGSLTFEQFVKMNDFVGVSLPKNDLIRIYNMVDRNKSGIVRLQELRVIVNQQYKISDEEKLEEIIGDDQWDVIEHKTLTADQQLERLKTNEIYETVKVFIETKNVPLENILYVETADKGARPGSIDKKKAQPIDAGLAILAPNALVTSVGIQRAFQKMGIEIEAKLSKLVVQDVRDHHGKFDVTYKEMIEFMTKRRINLQFQEKGTIDPLMATCVFGLNQIKLNYSLTYEQLFGFIQNKPDCAEKPVVQSKMGVKTVVEHCVGKDQFVKCLQGMGLDLSIEDISELFNYMDGNQNNSISKTEFINSIIHIISRMGIVSQNESGYLKQQLTQKRITTNQQAIQQVFNSVCESIKTKNLSIKQLWAAMDINRTGYINRGEFKQAVQQLNSSLKTGDLLTLYLFLDEKNMGKISIHEFLKVCLDVLNQMIGGGAFAFSQIQPIIQRIVNELSVDCDRFFDELAELNQTWLNDKELEQRSQVGLQKLDLAQPLFFKQNGLCKSLLFSLMNKYGVALREQEKALITSVFALEKKDREKLDYERLDAAFEAVQQVLNQSDSQFTSQWERRIFKKIGNYLMHHNVSIQKCFEMIDTDSSTTISLEELKQALIRFNIGLKEKEIKIFLKRIDQNEKGYLSKSEFLGRFWSAYTYEDVFGDDKDEEERNPLGEVMMPAIEEISLSSNAIQHANMQVKSRMDERVLSLRVFKQINKRIRETCSVSEAFKAMDSNKVGYLTLRDFQTNLSGHFDLSLKSKEVRELFQEIDSDENGIILFKEFDKFYQMDYAKRIQDIQIERRTIVTQNEIFDHLMKILKQKGLTLQQVFDQIDDDKNNFIEIDEFHDMLERLGFTISIKEVTDLMCSMDENFDGKLSYAELKSHLEKLGFDLDDFKNNAVSTEEVNSEFNWRDKALELVTRVLKKHLKASKQTLLEYFLHYDTDHDEYLSAKEFRQAILALQEPQIQNTQIERIMHILLEEKKFVPMVSIERLVKLITNYTKIKSEEQSDQIVIDEDLFVYIVEKYDGLSRMMEFTVNVDDRIKYLASSSESKDNRGLILASNQKTVQQVALKSLKLNNLYQSTLELMSEQVISKIKSEVFVCVLDPVKNVQLLPNEISLMILNGLVIPTIENSMFDIDQSSVRPNPNGALTYDGVYLRSKEAIEVVVYPTEILQFVSQDGKSLKRHLAMELQVHRYLMGCENELDDELLNSAFQKKETSSHIFSNLGKFEKKIGLSVNEKEIYVVSKAISQKEWINLDDFVTQNGGLLNIPLFYHTDAPLYIIRHWASLILQIIQKCHDASIVLRALSTKQLWLSRDGQRIKLGHVRGAGKLEKGVMATACDIQINLENNEKGKDAKHSSTMSPSKGGGQGKSEGFGGSSRRTNDNVQKTFSNICLDTPFIPPEVLFSQLTGQTSKMDVWAFGMIMFCLLFGKKPVSYYQAYRQWFLKQHHFDVEMSSLPFTPPSNSNFLYDPFSIDFENPFDQVNIEDLAENGKKHKNVLGDLEAKFRSKDGKFNFANFMKCIEQLSYSSMFSDGNSKKFNFASVKEKSETDLEHANEDAMQDAQRKGLKVVTFDDVFGKPKEASLMSSQDIHFEAQQTMREQMNRLLTQNKILKRKNELGLILDLISSCLDSNPVQRPTVNGLINSHIFKLDNYELVNSIRFSKNVILYRSPVSNVSMCLTYPLRQICAELMKAPFSVYNNLEAIFKIFAKVENCIGFVTSQSIDEINDILTEEERRKGTLKVKRSADQSQLRVSPNSPLAAFIVEEKVIDMLLFITFRYLKNFKKWKEIRLKELKVNSELARQEMVHLQMASVSQSGYTQATHESKKSLDLSNRHEQLIKDLLSMENQVLYRMSHLLKTIVYQMQSYSTPMAPFASEVINYIVKFFIGEENIFGSSQVLTKTTQDTNNSMKEFLRDQSFFRKEADLNADFKQDIADKLWHLEQKSKGFLGKSNYWCQELHREALKVYKDAITESGMGQSCYPVLNDYISSVSNEFEPTKTYSGQMNHLLLHSLIPQHRTTAYYNELIPIAEALARLQQPNLEVKVKMGCMQMIRSIFQNGNSDKIKACLDMRVPNFLVVFLQDPDENVRRECMHSFHEISKGLLEDEFEVIATHSTNLKSNFSKNSVKKTSFDMRTAVTMASYAGETQKSIDTSIDKRGTQSRQGRKEEDQKSLFIKRTISLIEPNENEKYINFALDLTNLNFLSSKRFLKEMATCFESPIFIAPLVSVLKTHTESKVGHENRELVLDTMKNLFAGNDRVLKALANPAYDTYLTILKILINLPKPDPGERELLATAHRFKLHGQLQQKSVSLIEYMFEQRRPAIIKEISCIGASSTLLKEQYLEIPAFVSLPDLMAFFDDYAALKMITPENINPSKLIKVVKNIRCWIKFFYDTSNYKEDTKMKAIQRAINLLIKILKVVWKEYMRSDEDGSDLLTADTKIDYMQLIRICLSLFEWLCINDKHAFVFSPETGRQNLTFVINLSNSIICQFRLPMQSGRDKSGENRKALQESVDKTDTTILPLENLNSKTDSNARFDILPFTDVGAILQNILCQLLRKNDHFLNTLLSECNFGCVFGEQVLLEYELIRHCIDNKVESLVLMDSYVKKNEIRVNTFEYLLRNSEHSLKDQLIQSNFWERIFQEFVGDYREFDIQFTKIDLAFLAFRKSFPLRLEAISLINTTLLNKKSAPQVFNQMLMYARRHLLIRQELQTIKVSECVAYKEATVLLLFSVFLESNEPDLITMLVHEGAPQRLRELMNGQPSLKRRFPILRQFLTKFE